MSIPDLAPGTSPAEVLADAVALVRAAAETLWSARSDDELVDTVGQVQQVTAALAAVEAGALAEADARDLAKQPAYGSTGDWVTHLAGLRRGEGKRRVARAKALVGPLVRTREALVAGVCSPGQADVIVSAVEDLPPQEWTRRRGEKLMLRHAQSLDATELDQGGPTPGHSGRPRRTRPQPSSSAGTRGTRRPPGPVPVDRGGPGRWGPDPRPRHGRGRRPPHRSPPPPHQTPTRRLTGTSRKRPARPAPSSATPATTAPASGTPWSPSPNTPSTPTGSPDPRHPRPTPGHPRPPDPARHPRSQRRGHHHRRPRPTPRRGPPARL